METEQKAQARADLEALAKVLDKVQRKHFAYGTVAKKAAGLRIKTPHCGSSGCAVGYMACMSRFRKRGLRLYADASGDAGCSVVLNGSQASWSVAAAEVLGISRQDAHGLFTPGSYFYDDYYSYHAPGHNATPKQVAKHIRNYIRVKLS